MRRYIPELLCSLGVAILVGVAVSPVGAQWRLWGRYQRSPIYFQKLQQERSSVTVWIKHRQVVGRVAFDCSNKSVRQVAAVKNGEPFDDWGEYYSVAPNTLGAWLYAKACP